MTEPAEKPRIRVRQYDSFANLQARLGYGAENLLSASGFGYNTITKQRQSLDWMYRGSWVVRKVVDLVAEDMTRAGLSVDAGLAPDQQGAVGKAMEALNIWGALCTTVKWSRLYGGALAFMMIDGQNPASPLRPDTIRKGQFKGLYPIDRWRLRPNPIGVITDYGPDFGMPIQYDLIATQPGHPTMTLHHSRVIRIDGDELPYYERQTENTWGQSVVESFVDRLMAFDSGTMGASQLLYKAHLRFYKIKGFRDLVATGGKALEGFIKQMETIRLMQTNEGMTIGDMDDEFQTFTYSFSGISDVLLQLAQQLSGATGIPLVRLMGQSPAGLNATGDSDIRLYYDTIHAAQEAKLRSGLTKVHELLCRSELGIEPPEDMGFTFNPLWQMSDAEKATIAKANADTVLAARDAGVISDRRTLEELKAGSRVSGVFATISDEEIEDADEEIPDPAEMMPEGTEALAPGAEDNQSDAAAEP